MNFPYSLQYYHSCEANDSYLSSYSCVLQDGGLLIVQAIKSKVDLIFCKDKKKRVLSLPISSKKCPKLIILR